MAPSHEIARPLHLQAGRAITAATNHQPATTITMSTRANERRRYPRVAANVPATYRSGDVVADGRVVNLSQSGLRLDCRPVDPVGTAAEVTLTLPGRPAPVPLAGSVVWSVEGAMGIELARSLPREQRAALADYIIQIAARMARD